MAVPASPVFPEKREASGVGALVFSADRVSGPSESDKKGRGE
jgi:hypothetical protein